MPFVQVRILQVDLRVGVITFFSAGENQTILCETTVQLEAIVVGDLTGHTFEWEQISGTPVTLNDANTLTPWFVNPNTTDITFRFYLDRGTPEEQFKDVILFRNPSDITTNFLSIEPIVKNQTSLTVATKASDNKNIRPSDRLKNNISQSLQPDFFVRPTSFSDQNRTYIEDELGTESMLVWANPTGETKYSIFEGVEIQRYDSGSWVFEAFRPKGTNYYNIIPGEVYRLVAQWDYSFSNQTHKQTDGLVHRATNTRNLFKDVAFTNVGRNLLSTVTQRESANIIITNPSRISRTESDITTNTLSIESVVGPGAAIRYVGIIEFQQLTITPSLSNVSLTDTSETVITRFNGTSIGS